MARLHRTEVAWVNVALLLGFFALNVRKPEWKPWSDRAEKSIARLGAITAILAEFTSFSFFSIGQSGLLLKATADEKFDRLKNRSIALAELMLTARMTQNTESEKTATLHYLDTMYAGVVVDLHVPPTLTRRSIATQQRQQPSQRKGAQELWRERIRSVVRARATELKDYIGRSSGEGRSTESLSEQALRSMVTRSLTAKEIDDAHARFEKASDAMIKSASDFGFPSIGSAI
ncbi:MAG: hypothetical protein WDO56_09585 [Gammaproteobacteria bacterium]